MAAAVAVRLAIEMRACRLAVVSLGGAGLFRCLGAVELDWILAGPGIFASWRSAA